MPTLDWHKREEAVRAATRAPYRLLEPVVELSYGDADSENRLIHGDYLDALAHAAASLKQIPPQLALKLAKLERKIEGHDPNARTLFDAIRELAAPPASPRKATQPS